MNRVARSLLGLAALVGLAAGGPDIPGILDNGKKNIRAKTCPRCGGKARFTNTTGYCLKKKCGWFEVNLARSSSG